MVDWASLDDMVAKAVEENLDGERVWIVPRVAGEFTGFVADDERASEVVVGVFAESTNIQTLAGEGRDFRTNAQALMARARLHIRKAEFACRASWPTKGDQVVRLRDDSTYCVGNVAECGETIDLALTKEG